MYYITYARFSKAEKGVRVPRARGGADRLGASHAIALRELVVQGRDNVLFTIGLQHNESTILWGS